MNNFKKWEKQFFNNNKQSEDLLSNLLISLVSPFFDVEHIDGYYGHGEASVNRDLKLTIKPVLPLNNFIEDGQIIKVGQPWYNVFLCIPFSMSLNQLKKEYIPVTQSCLMTDDFYMLVCFTLLEQVKNKYKFQTIGSVPWLPSNHLQINYDKLETQKSDLVLHLENKLWAYYLETGKIFK